LFSFVLSLSIVAGSFAIRQSKTILARSCEAGHSRPKWQRGGNQIKAAMIFARAYFVNVYQRVIFGEDIEDPKGGVQ
jgi:hypothetical protein